MADFSHIKNFHLKVTIENVLNVYKYIVASNRKIILWNKCYDLSSRLIVIFFLSFFQGDFHDTLWIDIAQFDGKLGDECVFVLQRTFDFLPRLGDS